MFLIYGKKSVKRKRGWVADYCPVCRVPSVMSVKEHLIFEHLYWIPLKQYRNLGLESTCQRCGVFLSRSRGFYSSFEKNKMPIEALVDLTNPDLLRHIEELLEFESEAIQSPPGDDARLDFMAYTINSLHKWAATTAAKGASESLSAVLTLLFLVNAVAAALLWQVGNVWAYPCTVISVVLFVIVLRRALVSTKKATGQAMIPKLARAIVEIDPSLKEIQAVWQNWLSPEIRKAVSIEPTHLRDEVTRLIRESK